MNNSIKKIVFIPRPQYSAQQNMESFINACRNDLAVFGNDLNFDSSVWEITASVERKGLVNTRQRVTFSTLKTAQLRQPDIMEEPFLNFAKAYFRYWFGNTASLSYGHLMSALRVLEASLKEFHPAPDPAFLTAEIFNRALQIASDNYSEAVAYRIGVYLQGISGFLTKKKLVGASIMWRSSLKKPLDVLSRTGVEFDKRRRDKLISQAAWDALPNVFLNAQDTVDILMSSIAAILVSAPSRVSEVLLLPRDCKVVSLPGSSSESVFGLRWFPSKGAQPMVKPVISSMASVVNKALEKIIICTEPAREIARWYENNPKQVFLPPKFEYLRKSEHMRISDLVKLFSLRDIAAGRDWCKARKIACSQKDEEWLLNFKDFEDSILALLPKGFPVYSQDTGIKYSEALIVVRVNELHKVRAQNPCMFETVSINTVNNNFGSAGKHGKQSMFSRFGYTEPDGSPIYLTTHQFRHLLNTFAQASHVSQLDIAKWSGRTDVSQNAVYDHVAADQILEQVREVIASQQMTTSSPTTALVYPPISIEDYAKLRAPAVHITDIGVCVHDFVMAPCSHHLQCILCEDLVCIKGIKNHKIGLKTLIEETSYQLEEALKEDKEGNIGASRWVEHNQQVLIRAQELYNHLESGLIPEGAVIQLSKTVALSESHPKILLAVAKEN